MDCYQMGWLTLQSMHFLHLTMDQSVVHFSIVLAECLHLCFGQVSINGMDCLLTGWPMTQSVYEEDWRDILEWNGY